LFLPGWQIEGTPHEESARTGRPAHGRQLRALEGRRRQRSTAPTAGSRHGLAVLRRTPKALAYAYLPRVARVDRAGSDDFGAGAVHQVTFLRIFGIARRARAAYRAPRAPAADPFARFRRQVTHDLPYGCGPRFSAPCEGPQTLYCPHASRLPSSTGRRSMDRRHTATTRFSAKPARPHTASQTFDQAQIAEWACSSDLHELDRASGMSGTDGGRGC
jgi:hypothetical protein